MLKLSVLPFPVEIVDQVVRSALLTLTLGRRRPSLAPLSGFSRASKQSRAIALRRWFLTRSRVPVRDQTDWDMVSALGMWIREIACTDSGVRLCKRLPPLLQLRAVHLDFNNHTPFKFRRAYIQTLSSLPHNLVSLTLNSLPIIDKPLLENISAKFSRLTDLRLSTVGRLIADGCCCCSCCPINGERQRLLSVQHSPIPDPFQTAQQLGVRLKYSSPAHLTVDVSQRAFGIYLARLTSLKNLHLGIYLSPEYALDKHNREHDGEQDLDSAGVTSNPLARLADCPTCCKVHANSTRQKEKDASLVLASLLPSLETIEWASCFVLMKCLWEDEELSESWGTTKLAVVRNGMKVKVERIPEIIYGYEWNYSPC